MVSNHVKERNGAGNEESGRGPTGLCSFRTVMLLYVHDRGGRRRPKGGCEKIPGYLRSNAQGELYPVAGRADHQFPHNASSISDSFCQHHRHCLDGVLESDELDRGRGHAAIAIYSTLDSEIKKWSQ